MTNKIVMIDLDEVVCDTNELLLPIFNHTFHKKFEISDWNQYDICSLYGITAEQYYDMFDTFNLASNAPPCVGALEAIDILISNSITPIFVTARRPLVDTAPTLKWFERHRVDASNLHVIGHHSKAHFMRDHYISKGYTLLGAYDDNIWNMLDFHDNFPNAVLGLIDRPHNQCFNHAQYPRVQRTNTLLSGALQLIQDVYDDRH